MYLKQHVIDNQHWFKPLYLILVFILGCSPYSLPEKKESPPVEIASGYYLQALDYKKQGEDSLALLEIDKALGINDNFAQYHQLKGDIYRSLGQYDQALRSYHKAINQRSNFIRVHESMAQIYYETEKFQEASSSYRRILALEPTYLKMYLEIARCYMAMKEWEIAFNNLGDYKRNAIELSQTVMDDYYYLLGKTLFYLGNFSESVSHLKQVGAPLAEEIEVLALLGRNYYALNDFESGMSFFNRLIQKNKSNGEWYLYRGIYFYQKNDYGDAKGQFLIAMDLDNTLADVHYYLARIYESEGDLEKALISYRLYRDNTLENERSDELDSKISYLESLTTSEGDSIKTN